MMPLQRIATGKSGLVRIAFCAGIVFVALGLYAVASHLTYDSDMVQNYLELHAVLAGNPLLSQWVLVSDNFYLTDLPFYVVLSLVVGVHWTLLYVVPWLVYLLLLLVAASLAARACGGGRAGVLAGAAALFYLGMLFSTCDSLLLVSAYHNATLLFALAALSVSGPALRACTQIGWERLVPLGALIFVIAASDPFGHVFFIAPLVFVMVFRILARHGMRETNVRILAMSVAAAIVGAGFPWAMQWAGGFRTAPAFNEALAPPGALWASARAIAGGFLDLFGSRAALMPAIVLAPVIAAIRLAAALFAAASVVAVLVRARRRPDEAGLQVLSLGCAAVAAADLLSWQFADKVGADALGQSLRYVVPLFVFSAIVASARIPAVFGRVQRLVGRRALGAMAIAAALVVAIGFGEQAQSLMREPPAAPQQWQAGLARWLSRRGLSYGVGDYWTANATEALSGGAVSMNAIRLEDGRLQEYAWITDLALEKRFGPPQFVAFATPNKFGVTLADVEKTYQKPAAIYRWPRYLVVVLRPSLRSE